MQHSSNCSLLVQTQSADERDVDGFPAEALIAQVTVDTVFPQQIQRRFEAAAR